MQEKRGCRNRTAFSVLCMLSSQSVLNYLGLSILLTGLSERAHSRRYKIFALRLSIPDQ